MWPNMPYGIHNNMLRVWGWRTCRLFTGDETSWWLSSSWKVRSATAKKAHVAGKPWLLRNVTFSHYDTLMQLLLRQSLGDFKSYLRVCSVRCLIVSHSVWKAVVDVSCSLQRVVGYTVRPQRPSIHRVFHVARSHDLAFLTGSVYR